MRIDQSKATLNAPATKTYHHELTHELNKAEDDKIEYVWEMLDLAPFDELIISWNALRPQYGGFKISLSLKLADWSPWFPYCYWGDKGQWGGDITSIESSIEIKHDIISLTDEQKGTGFKIRVEAVDGANLEEFYYIYACASRIRDLHEKKEFISGPSIDLKVPLVSQMSLPHVRKRDMCSPASTSAAISYLLKKNRLDPIAFAMHVHDDKFDIFGNWVLNTAHASSVMGKGWKCWVQRLQGFGDIYKSLQEGMPVVVSVKGNLPGSSFVYAHGHLIVVKGYRVSDNQVLCMDPAFPDDLSTNVSYKLDHFMEAWSQRHLVAYLFST